MRTFAPKTLTNSIWETTGINQEENKMKTSKISYWMINFMKKYRTVKKKNWMENLGNQNTM